MSRQALLVPDVGSQQMVLCQWLIAPGDSVLAGDRVAELLSEGMLLPLISDWSGVIDRHLARTGQTLQPGETVGWVALRDE